MVNVSYSSLLVLILVGCAAAQFRFNTANTTCSRFVQWNRVALPNTVIIPSRRFDMAVAVDPRTNNLFVTGGTSDQFEVASDLYSFNTAAVEWTNFTAPTGPISDHTATYFNGTLLVFGGKVTDDELKNDLFIYDIDTNTWTNPATTNTPEPRYGHSAAVYNNSLFVFGGRFVNATILTNELWGLNLATLEWTLHNSTNTPAPRLWHTTVLINNKWILYGGYNGVSGTSDVWSLDFATLQWTQISSTSPLDPRSGHVAFVVQDQMFVVGGEYDDADSLILNNNDVWSFDPAANEWTQWCSVGTSIHPRLGARGDSATLNGVTGGLIFGGLTTDTTFSAVYAYNDVWAMSLVPETPSTPSTPSNPSAPKANPQAPKATPQATPNSNNAATITLASASLVFAAAALF